MDDAPTVALILITMCYVPKISKSLKTKDVSGQSVAFWYMLDVVLLCNMFQQIDMIMYEGTHNYLGLIANGLNLLFAIFQTGLIIKYQVK